MQDVPHIQIETKCFDGHVESTNHRATRVARSVYRIALKEVPELGQAASLKTPGR